MGQGRKMKIVRPDHVRHKPPDCYRISRFVFLLGNDLPPLLLCPTSMVDGEFEQKDPSILYRLLMSFEPKVVKGARDGRKRVMGAPP